ncbi:4'-phosphopantetheinyl transferase family protein [Leifsonia sp. Le1]|uniref:4'-phosphopantetheinyl transferase family protein n=1 Tax=Leifsonia sp. Le1 TaxID=3404918 RepID=UPI003EBCC915
MRTGDLLLRRGTAVDGRAMLRELVAELAAVPADDVRIAARCPDCGGEHGRPVVMAPDAATGVRVSLAHAGDVTVAAALAGGSVGVDAEPSTAPETPTTAAATDLRQWTRIEAVLKADGRGLRVDPAAVAFERTGDLLIASVPGDPRRYEVRDARLGDDLYVTVAIER